MSGAPKRSHEEGSHPTTSKRSLEENPIFSNLPGKFVQPVSNDYHSPYEPWHDGRLAKVPRIESRDGDKRQSLVPIYRLSSSTNEDHPVASENRPELRDSNENRGAKIDNKETKTDLYTEIRTDPHAAKDEKDLISENRGDDKEIKSHRESLTDFHGEIKIEKDENRESLIWNIMHNSLRNIDENRKEASTTEEREHFEAHEAVGENKVDMKGEEKLREKERKKKDEKHKEWGERDKDRNDRRSNLQLGGTSTERVESTKEEKERCERERRDVPRDKERPKDRDKEHIKREMLNANEKETLHEKEHMDGSVRTAEQESSASEPKRLREFDSWKAVDRDVKDRKREKDLDAECDRHEKRARCYDKESDDGCIEADGVSERDREAFGYGVQQRRRMLRPRGTPASNREPRFRSRPRDNDGYAFLCFYCVSSL